MALKQNKEKKAKKRKKEITSVLLPPVYKPANQFDHSVLLGVLERLRRQEEKEQDYKSEGSEPCES